MPEAAGGTQGTQGTEGTQQGTQGTQGAQAPWHGITDPAAATYVTNKGWQSPADVIKSYQGAEKLIGRDPSTLLVMPRADDPAGQRAVFAKLGMPETADKYEFHKTEGGTPNPAYEAWARSTFHELGLTAAQAKTLTQKNNEFVSAQQKEATAAYERTVQADKTALLGEWRGGYERMMNAAQSAVKALGFTGDMVDALEQSMGYAGTMKFFAALGQKMGEDSFVSGTDGKPGFGAGQTPAEAEAEWNKMKIDPIQVKALQDPMHPGHEAAKAKQKQLFGIMYPAG